MRIFLPYSPPRTHMGTFFIIIFGEITLHTWKTMDWGGERGWCRSPDSWLWTDHSQISLTHSPTPPKCSTRTIMALINNLGIVYHQYCSSSYLDYICADPGPFYHYWQWKSSSNLIPTRLPEPELQSQSWLPTDLDESPKAPSTLNLPLPTQSL